MRIELDLFSGRPNPRWETTAADDAQIAAAVARLTPSAGGSASPAGRLGYRGFVVTDDAGLARMRVNGALVEIGAGAGVGAWQDADRVLERTLAEQARRHLPREVYELLAAELDGRR